MKDPFYIGKFWQFVIVSVGAMFSILSVYTLGYFSVAFASKDIILSSSIPSVIINPTALMEEIFILKLWIAITAILIILYILKNYILFVANKIGTASVKIRNPINTTTKLYIFNISAAACFTYVFVYYVCFNFALLVTNAGMGFSEIYSTFNSTSQIGSYAFTFANAGALISYIIPLICLCAYLVMSWIFIIKHVLANEFLLLDTYIKKYSSITFIKIGNYLNQQ